MIEKRKQIRTKTQIIIEIKKNGQTDQIRAINLSTQGALLTRPQFEVRLNELVGLFSLLPAGNKLCIARIVRIEEYNIAVHFEKY